MKLNNTLYLYKNGSVKKAIKKPKDINITVIYHDQYYDENTDRYYDITFSHCPFTGCSTVYFGKFYLDNSYVDNIVLTDGKISFKQISGEIIKGDHINLRRLSVKMFYLRELLSKYPDCQIIDDKDCIIKKVKNKKISDPNYYTLVYGIIYQSKKGYYKYSVIKDNNKNFDISSCRYTSYIKLMSKKIKNKFGTLIPCYYGPWIDRYPNSRVVQIRDK